MRSPYRKGSEGVLPSFGIGLGQTPVAANPGEASKHRGVGMSPLPSSLMLGAGGGFTFFSAVTPYNNPSKADYYGRSPNMNSGCPSPSFCAYSLRSADHARATNDTFPFKDEIK
jgi:hypothetical protein